MSTPAEKKAFDRIVEKIDMLRQELDMHIQCKETISSCHRQRLHPFAIEPVPIEMAKILEGIIAKSGITYNKATHQKPATELFPKIANGYAYDVYYLKAHDVGIGKLRNLENLIDEKIDQIIVEKVAKSIEGRHPHAKEQAAAYSTFVDALAERLGHTTANDKTHTARLARTRGGATAASR